MDITEQVNVTVSMDSLWLSSRAKLSLVGSPLPCSRYRVSWERKAENVHLTCRMTKVRTQQPTVGTLGFPVLLPPLETSGHWHCALSQQSHCCGPSETPPSQLWICQADQRHSRNNHLSEGWQLLNRKREKKKRVSFKPLVILLLWSSSRLTMVGMTSPYTYKTIQNHQLEYTKALRLWGAPEPPTDSCVVLSFEH